MAKFCKNGLEINELKNVLRLQSQNESVTYAYLSHSVLKHMSDIFPANFLQIKSLFLDSCEIEILHRNTFSKLTFLEHLDLKDNKIVKLENNLFLQNKCLRYLILKNNKIKQVTFEFLNNMKAIRELDLSKNVILFFSYKRSRTLSTLRLDHNNFYDFENNNFPALTKLYLSNNKLKHLNRSMFNYFVRLKKLYLQNNSIETIADDAFYDLREICHIFLDSNNIKIISDRVFKKNGSLEVLDLSRNLIETIDENTFRSLNKLNLLYLHFNNLKLIHQNWFQSTENLRLLNLSNNEINEIDSYSFCALANLTEFILDNNRTSLIIKAGHFLHTINLTKISLKNSQIAVVHGNSFRNLSKLKYLNLDCNVLEYLPDDFINTVPTHVHLNLKNNKLQKLQRTAFIYGINIDKFDLSGNSDMFIHIDAFQDFQALKELNLRGISFLNKTLPDLSQLENLELLDLSFCCIDTIPVGYFKSLRSLKKLLLDNNCVEPKSDELNLVPTSVKSPKFDFNSKYKFLAKKIFPKYNQLTYLQLSKCDILELYSIVLEDLHTLTYLNLSYNHLDSLDVSFLRNLKKLEELYLSHNNFRDFDVNVFKTNVCLKALDLTGNRIGSLNAIFFQTLSKLERLYIDKKCIVPYSYLKTKGVDISFESIN